MKDNEVPMGLRASTRPDGPGIRVDVVEMLPDGTHSKVAHIDYTPEQALAVANGFLLCMGKKMAVIL